MPLCKRKWAAFSSNFQGQRSPSTSENWEKGIPVFSFLLVWPRVEGKTVPPCCFPSLVSGSCHLFKCAAHGCRCDFPFPPCSHGTRGTNRLGLVTLTHVTLVLYLRFPFDSLDLCGLCGSRIDGSQERLCKLNLGNYCIPLFYGGGMLFWALYSAIVAHAKAFTFREWFQLTSGLFPLYLSTLLIGGGIGIFKKCRDQMVVSLLMGQYWD